VQLVQSVLFCSLVHEVQEVQLEQDVQSEFVSEYAA
jgi:hypothetical protein